MIHRKRLDYSSSIKTMLEQNDIIKALMEAKLVTLATGGDSMYLVYQSLSNWLVVAHEAISSMKVNSKINERMVLSIDNLIATTVRDCSRPALSGEW